jgi:hypothetical protein
MKYKLLIILILYQIKGFSQKDSTYRNHLMVKLAPFTYLGTHAAIQVGLETNLNSKITLGFDYAYGNSDIASYQKGGSYLDGESSHRYRLDYRWYDRPFAKENVRVNRFWSVELFNRTNYYPSTTTIGRNCAFASGFNNSCGYYERLSDDTIYQVWGIFFKHGITQQISPHFWLEWYGGLGVTSRTNTIGKYTLGANDRVFTNEAPDSNGSGFSIFDFHSATNFRRVGGDILLSFKVNYRIY